MKKKIILVGGGGHCKSCIDVIESENKFEIVGIIDIKEKKGQQILGYPIIGTDNDLDKLAQNYDYFLITLGQIKYPDLRIKVFKKVKDLGKNIPVIISPKSNVSKYCKVGEGSIILHNAIINAGSNIGKNCIINTSAIIEHDCIIYDNTHVSTSATINGNCTINSGTFIGSNSTINQGISIAKNCVVGSGSVVTKSIEKGNSTWIGTPDRMKNLL